MIKAGHFRLIADRSDGGIGHLQLSDWVHFNHSVYALTEWELMYVLGLVSLHDLDGHIEIDAQWSEGLPALTKLQAEGSKHEKNGWWL